MGINIKQKFDDRFRYERKYIINNYHEYYIDKFLKFNDYQFYEIYEPRYVNNIYFDTFGLQYYRENVSGIANRKKIRIRWYNNNIQEQAKKFLEIKIKNGHVGRKQTFKLEELNLKKYLNKKIMIKKLENLNVPQDFCDTFSYINPTLINKYKRRYFLSKNGNIRVTIDDRIKYYPVSTYLNKEKNKFIKCLDYVLEIKYSVESDYKYRDITEIIPHRLSRNSKYVNGINLMKENYII